MGAQLSHENSDLRLKCFLNSLKFQLILLIFLACTREITHFGKIQTFYSKYRPNKDPFCSKGLYYRPRSLNKDPTGCTGLITNVDLVLQYLVPHPNVLNACRFNVGCGKQVLIQ